MLKSTQKIRVLSTIRRGLSTSSSKSHKNCDNVQPVARFAKLRVLAVAVVAVLAPAQVQAYEFLDGFGEINFLALQNYQAIQAKEGAFRPVDEKQSSGAGRIRVNLQLKFYINEHITADVDIAEEPNDFGNNGDRDFSFHQDFAGIEFELLGLSGIASSDSDLTLRVGNIGASPFQFKGFQDGADNQGNALIGNGITDYATAENGAQLSYSKSLDSGLIRSYNVSGHITTSSFGEAFQEDRGFNFRLQGKVEFASSFKAGLSFFQANQGDQLRFDGNGMANLAGVTTTNYRFGDGENYNFSASASSERDTHVGIMPGLDQSIIQLDLAYQPTPETSVILMLGQSSDDYTFADAAGNPVAGITYFGVDGVADTEGTTFDSISVIKSESSVQYYTIEAQHYILPNKFYVAARYSDAENTSDLTAQTDNTVERIQIAAGYWFNDKTLLKFEYVDQEEGANSGGQIGAGFDGFTSEISVKF